MANAINGGGPAFPVSDDAADMPGMSLRDYFAAKAMQALINQRCYPHDADVGHYAYAVADAMLHARQGGRNG